MEQWREREYSLRPARKSRTGSRNMYEMFQSCVYGRSQKIDCVNDCSNLFARSRVSIEVQSHVQKGNYKKRFAISSIPRYSKKLRNGDLLLVLVCSVAFFGFIDIGVYVEPSK